MNSLRKSFSLLCLRQRKVLPTRAFQSSGSEKTEVTADEPVMDKRPLEPILHRDLQYTNKYMKPREVWIENMDTIKEEKRGLVELNSSIFGTMPRIDLIYENVKWQTLYRKVILYSARSRAEMSGGGRKPHPQKGLGVARQGSIRAPHMKGGGSAHGPRNPTTYYYLPNYYVRVYGLTSTLSAKFAQNNVHVVDNLDIPTEDGSYLLDLIEERKWGDTVLIIDDTDMMPKNITLATEEIPHVTLMPVYGLNVYSMLKHEALVLTMAAVNELESKLVKALNTAREFDIKSFR